MTVERLPAARHATVAPALYPARASGDYPPGATQCRRRGHAEFSLAHILIGKPASASPEYAPR
jgi:hypothetical protein